jgi:hypothetical protein
MARKRSPQLCARDTISFSSWLSPQLVPLGERRKFKDSILLSINLSHPTRDSNGSQLVSTIGPKDRSGPTKPPLLFAEIPANNIDGHGVHVFMHPSGYEGSAPFKGPELGSNGMTIDADGRVTVAGHARRNVWRLESLSPNAQITVLADVYQGKKLNSPNDLVYKSPILRTDYRPKVITIRRKNCKLMESIAFLQRASKSWEHSLTEKNFSFSLRISVGPTALRSLQMKNSCT